MNRALRRHKSATARKRKDFVITRWRIYEPWWIDNKIWQYRNNPRRAMWSTPSWWTNLYMNRPARRESKALCLQVRNGLNSDSLNWPDYKKPHDYYW